MKLTVSAKLYPTADQKVELGKAFGASRFIYNWGLQRKSDQYKENGKSDGYNALSKALTLLKKQPDTLWLAEAPAVILQQSLQNLETAYTNFFKKRAKFPRFKSKHDNRQSANYVGASFGLYGNSLRLAKLRKRVKMRLSRELPSTPSSVTVVKTADNCYYARFICEVEEIAKTPIRKGIGLDLGVSHFAVDSEGNRYSLPKQSNARLRLKRLQRSLARKKKGSSNREKSRIKLARQYQKIQNIKRNFLHHLSKRLVVENQDIALEDLAVKNMLKNRKLARAISEQSWSEFRQMLEYKSRLYGRNLIVIDRFFPSSKTCCECGHVVNKLPLNIRAWNCPECGSDHDRDVNAAINILAAGYAVSACGEDGRPKLGYAKGGSSR